MKLLTTMFLIVVGFWASAQTISHTNPLTHSDVEVGDSITLALTNEGETTSQFYFRYWRNGMGGVFATHADYIQYLQNSCGPDSTEWARELGEAQALVYKVNYVNRGLLFTKWDAPQVDREAVARKLYSPIGVKLAIYSIQCGQRARSTKIDFLLSGKIPFGNIRTVSCDGHELNDIWYKGKYALMDEDVTALLWLPNYASFDDLVTNGGPNWLRSTYAYTDQNGDTVYVGANSTWTRNPQEWFDVLSTYGPGDPNPSCDIDSVYQIDGDVKLCAGCSITTTEVEENYFLDTSRVEGKDLIAAGMLFMQQLNAAAQAGDTATVRVLTDSMITLISVHLDVSLSEAASILAGNRMRVGNGSAQWQPTYQRTDVPTLAYHFPQRDEPYVLGVEAKFPGFVLGVEVSPGDSILLRDLPGDDTLITSNFHMRIMSGPKVLQTMFGELSPSTVSLLPQNSALKTGDIFWGDTITPAVTNKMFHYLQGGYVDASNGPVTILLSYNPNLFGIWGDMVIDMLDQLDTLDLEFVYPVKDTLDSLPPVGIEASTIIEEIFTVYPNPTTGQVTVETSFSGDLTVYNIAGQKVISADMHSGKNILRITAEPGIYFLRFGNVVKKVVLF